MLQPIPVDVSSRERGYVLLVLMLFVALLAVASLALCQKIEFEIRRDREEELIHRGVEYSRAVRKFVKVFGHYPASVEALENTNNIRFLRRRYKDPITGRDFKFLHLQDLQAYPGMAAATQPKVIPPPVSENKKRPPADAGNNIPSDIDSPPEVQSSVDADVSGEQPATGADAAEADATPPELPNGTVDPSEGLAFSSEGPIIGVASFSTQRSIREFNKKGHYDQWQFVYDPSTDHVGLLLGPNQPLLRVSQQAPGESGDQSSLQSSAKTLVRPDASASYPAPR